MGQDRGTSASEWTNRQSAFFSEPAETVDSIAENHRSGKKTGLLIVKPLLLSIWLNWLDFVGGLTV
jgi:hypothetical protein